MKLGRRRFPERGAAAIVVVLLLGSGALLGMGALTVDVGRIYVTRERLQSGADAAADAVASVCASAAGCTTASAVAAQRTRAKAYVDANAARTGQGLGDDVEVCGNWGYFASSSGCSTIALNGLTQCLGSPGSDTYIEVHVRTKMSNGSTLLPPTFGTALLGSSYHGKAVTACARVKATPTTTTTTTAPPAAVWANTTTNTFPGALWLHATTLTVNGLVHTNADLYIDATGSTVSPRVEYVTNQTVMVPGVPTPVKVSSGQPPGTRTFADYQPGGTAAVAAGSHYSTATCSGGTWTYGGSGVPASATIVYVPCNAVINSSISAMIVATGTITVMASNISIGSSSAAGTTGMLSNSNAMTLQSPAIYLGGSYVNVYGNIQALNGMVNLQSSQATYKCGVLGNALEIAGSIVNVTSDSTCGGTTTVTNGTGGIPRLVG
jgi:Flp pilus assembly protein TadG